ncbi:serine hydrolase domain-containing protein [Kitasatospora sp. CB01950]|uniref:serine hydrolase domain-containing protein n=1 Tax=Kitasatospora sp. CB01950 TaxID=1703930 RepID=UPI00093D2FC3|nr:serine hydrolase domain-containing protein [Kitasatospora sp. CB01950]
MKSYRSALRLAASVLAGASVFALAPAAGAATTAQATTTPTATPGAPGSVPVPQRSVLQQGLDALTDRAGATGAIAEVRDHGRAVWRGTSGVANLATRQPAPVDGEFRAGSITKTFVATVVLQLVAEHRLGLDDPIERHLPGLVPNGGTITVRQVMNHTAGLFDFLEDPRFAYESDDALRRLLAVDRWKTLAPRDLIAVGVSHEPYFAPGGGWHYSNTDYLVLGELVRQVTGNDWRTEVDHRVLQPLGLRHTFLPGTSTTVPGPHSHGYLPLPDGPADITELNPSMAGAAGELISTTDDLARFDAALLGGRLLPPAQLAEMTTTVAADEQPPTRYGLGLMQLRLSCGDVWGHPGGIHGYVTYLFGDRSGTRQIAISANPYDPQKGAELNPAVIGLIDRTFCGPKPTS